MKFILDFLVKMASDQKYGYNSSIVAEIKTHHNRGVLAEIFIELITGFKDYENCEFIFKFIETCLFNTSGLFNEHHIRIIENKLIDTFLIIEN